MMQKMVDLVERTKLLASSTRLLPSGMSTSGLGGGGGVGGGAGGGGTTAILSTSSHLHQHHQMSTLSTGISSSSVESSSSSEESTSTSPLSPTAVEEEIMIRSAAAAAVAASGNASVRSGSPFSFPSIMNVSPEPKTPAQFLLGLGIQILEGRLPDHKQAKGFLEGEHCLSLFKPTSHFCDYETNALCRQLAHLQYLIMPDSSTLCLEVYLTPRQPQQHHRRHQHHHSSNTNTNSNNPNEYNNASISHSPLALLVNNASNNSQVQRNANGMLIEKWRISFIPQEDTLEASGGVGGEGAMPGKGTPPIMMTPRNLHNAVRSFLHFSQLAAWLSKKKEFTSAWKVKIETGERGDNNMCSGAANSSTVTSAASSSSSSSGIKPDGWDRHEFPTVTLESQSFWDSKYQGHRNMYHPHHSRGGWGKGPCNSKWVVKVTVDSLPRMEGFPLLPVPSSLRQSLPGNNSTSITITANNTKPCLSSTSSPATSSSSTSTTTIHNASTKSQQMLYGDGGSISAGPTDGIMILGGEEESVPGVRIRFRGGRSRRSHASGGTNGSSSHRSRPKNLRIAIPDVSHSSEEDGENGCLLSSSSSSSGLNKNSTLNGTCATSGMKMESLSSMMMTKEIMMFGEAHNRHHNHNHDHYHQHYLHHQNHPNINKIPTLREKLQFETSLNHATSLVFHKSGLPLTSSPVPIRRCGVALVGGGRVTAGRFDFDSSLLPRNTRGRAIGCPHFHGQRLSEPSQSLLGSFEESVLNGRIEPVSTVEGFTAEVDVGSSHNFKLPVTVFFYTFCDNDRVSSPYSAHVTLSPTVYPVPRRGTVQVTLYNPMKTVVKMFVINYDLSNMEADSQTFIRQKILFMPLGKTDRDPNARKWLRYLIHLRFGSSPSGDKIYLHKDIRMIVLQKSDADTAVGLSSVITGGCHHHEKECDTAAVPYELRSFTYFAD